MVLGIAGLVLTCFTGLGVVAAIIALVLAPGARREIRSSGGRLVGEQQIRTGVICSWISVALTVAAVLLFVLTVGVAIL